MALAVPVQLEVIITQAGTASGRAPAVMPVITASAATGTASASAASASATDTQVVSLPMQTYRDYATFNFYSEPQAHTTVPVR